MAEETEVVKKPRNPPRIPRLKKWSMIAVEWHDAATSYEAHDSEQSMMKAAIRVTIGHFLRREYGSIMVAMEDDRRANLDGADCQTVTALPVACILKVTELVAKG